MPRPPRLLLPLSFYHIMTRGNNKNKIFLSEADYQYYLQLLAKYKAELPFDLYHYCLMPNHTHFLIKTKSACDFSTFMKKLNLSYFYHYKKQYGWTDHFWQGRFKNQPVGKDDYFIQCGKYIELNPLRANLAEKLEDYPYSSYRHYVLGEENDLVTEDIIYSGLGNTVDQRQVRYMKMVIDDIVIRNYKGKAWGSNIQRYNEAKKIKYHLS